MVTNTTIQTSILHGLKYIDSINGQFLLALTHEQRFPPSPFWFLNPKSAIKTVNIVHHSAGDMSIIFILRT